MTAPSLLVPVHLDALVLTEPDLLVGPAAHFSRLPHVWKGADVNPDVPNLGKSIVAPPFQDRSFLMDSGVHLHWALPDGLTRAQHPSREEAAMRTGPGRGSSAPGDGLSGGFPAVPNRWLVVRRHEKAGDWPVEAAWVVESDFLWPDDHAPDDKVSVPSAWTEPDPANPAPRPFRRMGRPIDLGAYPADLAGGAHLARPLTAMGYGDPTFATVYQNCHSVFGLHDPCVPVVDTRYDVFGWYSDPDRDPLRGALAGEPDDRARARAIELLFGWKRADTGAIPAGTEAICFVSMTIPGKRATKPRTGTVELAIGNTATEALSAHLARGISDPADPAGRDRLEDQLESMLLAPRMSAKQLDRTARLADARHEKGFVATFGGWIWTVTLQDSPKNSLAEAGTQDEEPAPLDAELASLLSHLNDLQRSHDREAQDLEAARGQLFADWCKYMHVVYPSDVTWQDHATFDGDELGVFVAQQADAVERLASDLRVTVLPGIETATQEVAKRVAELNKEREARKAQQFVLRRGPGPRFYRPTEPVLLIHGEAVRPTERHGQDGRENPDDTLLCHLSTAALFSPGRVPDPAVLCAAVDRLRKLGPDGAPPADRIGFCTWEQPWHPILLEWEVELTPFARDEHGAYPPDHIKSRYSLPVNAVAFTPGEAAPVHATSRRLTGCSILTPHAREQHEAALTACVVEHCACSHEHLKDHRATMETARRAAQAQPGEDFVCTALCALGEMEGKQFLSQALTGFNDALLGLHQSYQLPVADPIGFASERALARRVRDLVLSFNRSAPDDAGHFEPIRTGRLEVKRLRLVDTFGQIQDLRVEGAAAAIARPLRGPGGDGAVVLPPRFVQLARVNLRWFPAAGPAPAAGPICGWLILDNLDRSLLVHDAAGRALGVISGGSSAGQSQGGWEAGWQAAPGNDPGMKVWNIEDPHLRRLATWFVQHAGSPDGWARILKKIEKALDNIDPEAATHHEDLAVLMGRPLAVVRAGLSLGLAGPPAIHQGEGALFMDIQSGARQTDRFEDVTIPVRLGAHERANDGLVAYWRETPKGLRDEAQWPQSDDIDPIFVAPSSALDPVTLTMLVDPLAEVHATSGILPTKAITIPPGMYAAQLKRLEVSFRSLGPILTRVGRLDLPLPIEPGYAWSWIERDDRGWSAVAGDVGAAEDDGAFSGPIVAREGWMRLTKVEPPEPVSSDVADTGSTDVTPRPS
ncbi:hypothetical protein [Falsiroseomonas sp. E2-1-a4]|uniref:hypothetical protein n=1 Tax=Falsiroseomonas sp. E2-1-a4 TaxID=3239299 RepID=UPI003F3555C5